MADTNRQKNAYMANEVDEDPFAELTRIMGFDPRVPMRPAEQPAAVSPRPAPIAAPATEIVEDDLDFSMELEKELLGDFAEVTAANDAAPSRQAPANGQNFAAAAQPSGSAAFQEPAFEESDQNPQAYAQQEFAAADQYASDDRYADDEYYADDYGAAEPGAVDAYQPVSQQPVAAAALSHDYAPVYATAPSQQSAPEVFEEDLETDFLAAELDQALESSFESEFSAPNDEDWWEEEEQVQTRPEPVVAAAPEQIYRQPEYRQPEYRQPEARQADEFSADFDAAMAEVDMDFTAAPAVSRASADFDLDLDGFDDELDAAVARDIAVAPRVPAPAAHAQTVQYAPSHDDVSVAPSVDAAFDDFDLDDDWRQADAAAPQAALEQVAAEPVDANQAEIDDAIAELAAMVRSYDKPSRAPAVAPTEPVVAAHAAPREDTPDIETVDIVENAIALTDDLDIPELSFAEDAPPAYDDLDAELAAAFGEPAMETVRPAPATPPMDEDFDLTSGYEFADRYAEALESGMAASVAGAAGAAYAAHPDRATVQQPGRATRQVATDEFDFDDHFIDDEDVYADALPPSKPAPRRGMMIAAAVGGVALVAAVGAFAFSGGGSIGSGEPVLVKADTDPVKVKPANPGGVVVPNQESSVFDPETGKPSADVGTATQKALVSNEEAPVDVAAQFPDEAPQPIDESEDIESLAGAAGKAEDRVEQLVAADETAGQTDPVAVTPRKVRTMVVKPDGSLVPREEVAGTAAAEDVVGSTSAATSLTDPTVSAAPSAEVPATTPEQTAAVAPEKPAAAAPAQPAPAAKAKSGVPDSGPLAPSRPADQPLDIVGEVKPQQVAAAATAAPAGAWSMQIASQPSEAAAQSSYQDLARRYSSVLGGRGANIVKAEIAGKGTFWRVRVPADSRNEAVSLCEKYKAAGGNCFVSR